MIPAFERFPHDIFRQIMLYTYVHALGPFCEEAEFDMEIISPPVTASQVCRSWRRALLSDSTMWTCILFPEMSTEWIIELLRRSGSSLLNVILDIDQNNPYNISYDETSSLLSAVFQHIHRFKMLRAQINIWEPSSSRSPPTSPPDFFDVLHQQVVSYLEQPAPKLQTLSLWYNCFEYGPDNRPDYTIIGNLFSNDAPNLRRIHHRLSPDILSELRCPAFHGLSELRLTLVFNLNFGCFLDLLASSPRLKLLHLDVPYDNIMPYFDQPSDRKVNLPFLEKLLLEACFTVDLTDLVLKHVILPLNVKWHIVSRYHPDSEESPFLSPFLSRAQFTSLHIRAATDFTRLIFEEKPDKNHINRLIYYYYNHIQDLSDVWARIMHARKSSRITHMELDIGCVLGPYILEVFASVPSLKSLIIRPDTAFINASGPDKLRLTCLVALVRKSQNSKEAPNRITNMTSPMQDGVSTGTENTPTHNSDSSASTVPVFPCPLLREVTLELRDPLEPNHVNLLAVCSDMRRDAGYPFQMHVRCPEMKPDAEEILRPLKDKSIKISISSLRMGVSPYEVLSPYGIIPDA